MLPLVCFYNTSGTSVTAFGSAAARCTIEQLRNLLVWIYFMIFKVQGKYLEHFSWLQLSGFAILLFGILIFNEILTLPKLDKDIRYNRVDEDDDSEPAIFNEVPRFGGAPIIEVVEEDDDDE